MRVSTISLTCFRPPCQTAITVIAAFLARSPCDRAEFRKRGFAMTELGRLLGSGKEAEVFEYGALALKLYRPTAGKASSFREAANLAILERLALPTPKVHAVGAFDGRWGVLMDRAPVPVSLTNSSRRQEKRRLKTWRSCIEEFTKNRAKACRLSWRGFPPGYGGPRDWIRHPESGCCRNLSPFQMMTGSATAIFTLGIFMVRGRRR